MFNGINDAFNASLKHRNTEIESGLKTNQLDVSALREKIKQEWKKHYRTIWTEESMYYGAWISILSDMEWKAKDIINDNWFGDISKKLSLDGKAQVENAKNKFEKTAKEFKKTIDDSWWFWITTSAEKMITRVLDSIMSSSLSFFREVQVAYNQHVIDKWIQNKSKLKSSIENSSSWAINDKNVFTEESNKLTIHQIIDSSKLSDNDVFVLDYTDCTNENITNRAKTFSPNQWLKVYIERKEINGVKTFVYKWTDKRALVWEWIKIFPATKTMIKNESQMKWEEYKKNKEIEAEQEKQDQMWVLENYKALWINFRNGMKLTEAQDGDVSEKLYSFIESELNRLITGALNWISVPKKSNAPFVWAMTSWKLLVFETTSWQADQYILRKDELQKILWDQMGYDVYDFLDKSENEAILKWFMNNRWNKLYEKRVTKNKDFSIDAKSEWVFIWKNWKTYKKVDWVDKEVKLDDNQVFVDWLDVDWGNPENAVWVRNAIESEMDKVVEKINSWKISMPKNANPFNTNRNFATNWTDDIWSHFIEFEKQWSAWDEKVFEFDVLRSKNDVRKIFTKMDNRIKIKDYMNKLWRDKYTKLVKETKWIAELSNINDPVELNGKISQYLKEVLNTYKNNNKPNEEQKAELRIKIKEISEWLKKLVILLQSMQLWNNKTIIEKNIPIFGSKLAEITSGIWGNLTWINDADKVESALTKSEAEENIQIAIENIDYEISGKSPQELLDLYISKHRNIDNNFSKIDAFKQNAPAYMNALWKKIFNKIKEKEVTNGFTLDQKRSFLFELAQVARDKSDKINISNKFIDYDLSEEIFNELMVGDGWIINKLNPDDAIKPQHKESMWLSVEQRKSLFLNFPGWDQIADEDWIFKPYKQLSIEQRSMLATYKDYFDRFGKIDKTKLETDPTYVNLIAKQLVEMATLTSKFMMDDYSDRLDAKMISFQKEWKDGNRDKNTGLLFSGLGNFDSKVAKEYIDMKWIWRFNLTDRNTQKMKEYSVMAATLIAAVVATAVSCGAAWPALAWAITSIATNIWITITAAAAKMASFAIIWWVVGSAVMVGSEFIQWKSYETMNEWVVDVATMTAAFVWTSLLTMWIGNYLNKIPSSLSKIYRTSAARQRIVASRWFNAAITTVETAGSGAMMWAIENQRQEWLTGESHPEMVIQMMWLAMWMRVAFSGFWAGKSLAEKWIWEGKGKQLTDQNQKIINELEAWLRDPNTKAEVKPEIQKQLNEAKANQQKVSSKINTKNKMSETQIKEEIQKIEKKIEWIRSGNRNDPYRVESNEVLQNRIDNLRKVQNRWSKYVEQLEMAEKVLNERNLEIKLLQEQKTQLEYQLLTNQSQSNPKVSNNSVINDWVRVSKLDINLNKNISVKQIEPKVQQNQKIITSWEVVVPKQINWRVGSLLKLPINNQKMLALPPHQPFKPIPNMDIKFPYWLLPIFLLPLEDEKRRNVLTDIWDRIEKMIENPSRDGVELDSDITWPYDIRAGSNMIKQEIDAKFEKLIKENNIMPPLEKNSLILLRWVASWTYSWSGSGAVYNEELASKRAEEFKTYLMEKYPQLTEDNFIIWSFHKADDPVDTDPKRFQWVSMSVINKSNISSQLPIGQNWSVI